MLKVLRIGRDSVTLQWYPPSSDGGSNITKYIIMKKQMPIDMWDEAGSVNGSVTAYTAINLRENKQYYFAVCAVNSIGKGDWIETSRPVTPQRIIREYL